MKNFKTRFPPSPTGYLHIGSLRTALYNYLCAKKLKGTFILRVEDTDRTRYVEGAVESLINTMERVGLDYDEGPTIVDGELSEKGENGPYTQSARLEIYREYVQKLVDKGSAYHCFCSKERLTKVREQQQLAKLQPKYDRHCVGLTQEEVKTRIDAGEDYVIRLQIPEGETTFQDEVRGSVTIKNSEVDDQVLQKTDGFPTYHMAVVVDDHLMGVTHVIRAEEWISSVPKHIILYRELEFPIPVFAHLPLVLNPDKSKLSKRQGDVAVEDYLDKGYLPEALVNFVALLGFNPSGDQEIYTLDELIASFDLKKINKSGAVFDRDKLKWMNAQYIKKMETSELLERCKTLVPELAQWDETQLGKILTIEQERLETLVELAERLPMYKAATPEAEALVWKKSDAADAKQMLSEMKQVLEMLEEGSWTQVQLLEEGVKRYITDKEYQNGNVLWPLRVALSGKRRSPSPFQLLWALGKDESIRRIDHAITLLS
jgi:nondiscriminating glutamyl-tRNA synthetase